ncbi:MAG: tetratricopeptide repeat protein [candidate division NC10 bacterium]|nr:tetratricopeptide repeat protein [candidate division NC10 bacterium]
MDFDKAEAEFQKIIEVEKDGPLAPFFLSLVSLNRAGEEEEEPKKEELNRFLEQVGASIERAERALEKNPKDGDLSLLLGMAYGTRAIVEGSLKHYLSAYQGIKKAYRFLKSALEIDHSKHDAYYGLGIYDYSMGRLPQAYRFLASLILPEGGRDKGLQELSLAAEKGIYTRSSAKTTLMQTYVNQENNHEKALPYAEELKKRYPGNPEFYFYLGNIYSELGRFSEALAVAEEAGRAIETGRSHFKREMLPRHQHLLGKVYMDHGDLDKALELFKNVIASNSRRYAWVKAWAFVRMGMIYDLKGEREEAVLMYERALKVETRGIAKDYARKYLEEPYMERGKRGGRTKSSLCGD